MFSEIYAKSMYIKTGTHINCRYSHTFVDIHNNIISGVCFSLLCNIPTYAFYKITGL